MTEVPISGWSVEEKSKKAIEMESLNFVQFDSSIPEKMQT